MKYELRGDIVYYVRRLSPSNNIHYGTFCQACLAVVRKASKNGTFFYSKRAKSGVSCERCGVTNSDD